MDPVKIFPSILAADFARLGDEVANVAAVVDGLHIDVMDGHFVPNITMGFPIIESLRAVTDLYFDCHMMTTNPDVFVNDLAKAGGQLMSVHIEVFPNPRHVAASARETGLDFGLVISPPTPIEALEPYVGLCSQVLVMTVNPGFGGQSFMADMMAKVERLRALVDREGLDVQIQVDGGITVDTASEARDAGADVLVAGTAVFRQADPVGAVAALRAAARP